jgi:hypothetical protein
MELFLMFEVQKDMWFGLRFSKFIFKITKHQLRYTIISITAYKCYSYYQEKSWFLIFKLKKNKLKNTH